VRVRGGVEYGTISSHVGIKFTVAERAYWVISNVPPYIQGIVVGLILSDACLRISKGSVNAFLKFNQSTKHFEYFWFVYRLLSPIIKVIPLYYTGTRKDVPFYGIEFNTPNLPFLIVLKDLFYINSIKCIPECIYMLLTPIAMAHWILGDGTRAGYGLILCTHSFTIPDVVRLINVLMVRYRLDCTLQYNKGKPVIYIPAGSMPKLCSIVKPYMCPSMLRKLGL